MIFVIISASIIFGWSIFATSFVLSYAHLSTISTTVAAPGNNHSATTTFSNSTNSSSQKTTNASNAQYLGYHYEYNFY
ncbi:MAG TPA: hypothetical protein VN703_07160 [Candidatus Sulfopaludibacter sp.]|nr:hypothetical protein [Candidatus Sulfopaludibacter sp.]